MSKSLVEPGVWWVQGSAVWAGREGWNHGTPVFAERTPPELGAGRAAGCAKSAGVVLRIHYFKPAGWVDVWSGRTVYLVWSTLQPVSLAWGALSSPLKAWPVKFCSLFHVLECRVLIWPALGCLWALTLITWCPCLTLTFVFINSQLLSDENVSCTAGYESSLSLQWHLKHPLRTQDWFWQLKHCFAAWRTKNTEHILSYNTFYLVWGYGRGCLCASSQACLP